MEIFSTTDQDKIVQAISVAEGQTSGEIRLVVDRKVAAKSVVDAALGYFRKLDMHKTRLKNGVLIYLATEDHEFAIIGDEGISRRVDANFWDDTKEQMASFFRKGELVEGLVAGIHHTAEQLKRFYPRGVDDINELPDEIHFGKN
ncbi:TPM domain-containing protein [Sphingobacterium griseoflavum]|uniref:TPM domain-containing protein n=1 Tax=Sphingobacterium griseoflavum TaxID=1474952 RepID=A0ABQ3HUD5_9SPHI|nr:TPM domain-containing protein [Sphingobacterium griseoflavum]GHE28196.1 hypothetical protein GCM10017764_08170 [Sphingobacterium griseoflavum]